MICRVGAVQNLGDPASKFFGGNPLRFRLCRFFGFVGVGVIGASQQVVDGAVQVVSYRSYSLKSGGIF